MDETQPSNAAATGADAAAPAAPSAEEAEAVAEALSASQGPLDGALGLLGAGGPVLAILLVLSIAATAIVIVKLWQFRALGLGRAAGIEEAVSAFRAGRTGEALGILETSRHPAARPVAAAMRGRTGPQSEESRAREEVQRLAARELRAVRGQTRTLEVIAALSPLLGLFGTVLGMIAAFRQLEAAGAAVNPAVLSGGIWEALLTTAAGLAVAIPTVAAAHWLERVAERVTDRIEDAVTQVFTAPMPHPAPAQEAARRPARDAA
jgi:biopolymer transport protein ExbB